PEGAIAEYRQTLALAAILVVRSPAQLEMQTVIAAAYEAIGKSQLALGRRDQALASFELDREIAERVSSQDPANKEWRNGLKASKNFIAEARTAPRR